MDCVATVSAERLWPCGPRGIVMLIFLAASTYVGATVIARERLCEDDGRNSRRVPSARNHQGDRRTSSRDRRTCGGVWRCVVLRGPDNAWEHRSKQRLARWGCNLRRTASDGVSRGGGHLPDRGRDRTGQVSAGPCMRTGCGLREPGCNAARYRRSHARRHARGCWLPIRMILESVITCPDCGHARSEPMPTDACLFFYDCEACRALLRPRRGHCCVFCSYGSYGSIPCPPVQASGIDCCQPISK